MTAQAPQAILRTAIPAGITGRELERLILEAGFPTVGHAARYLDIHPATIYSYVRKRDRLIAHGKWLAVTLICYRDCLNRQIAEEQAQQALSSQDSQV